jgi:acetyltransferase-like isoleucine patch superfamily enzyme
VKSSSGGNGAEDNSGAGYIPETRYAYDALPTVWTVAETLRRIWMRVRFRAWTLRLRLELRRHGARLELHAPQGATFDDSPALNVYPGEAEGSGTLTLSLGRGVHLGRGLTLEIHASGENRFVVGDRVRLMNNVRILFRSGHVSIGAESQVRDGVWIKSDGRFETGREVTIGPYSAIHCTERIVFADRVGLGERVSIIDSDHTFDGTDVHYMRRPLTVSPVRLGCQTMVAFGSVVLRGTEIGSNSVVAANSVVRGGTYTRASLIAGNPAQTVKDFTVGSANGYGRARNGHELREVT